MAESKKQGVDSVRPVIEKQQKNNPKRLVRPAGALPPGANRKRVNKRSR